MPNSVAAAMTPFSVTPSPNCRSISGSATPVMKTTTPSKNLPAAASPQISHCISVIGEYRTGVASAQTGVSSMYSWTVFPDTPLARGGLLSGVMARSRKDSFGVRFRRCLSRMGQSSDPGSCDNLDTATTTADRRRRCRHK